MPRCTKCGEPKKSTDLLWVGGKRAWCTKCVRPLRLVEDLMGKTEKPESSSHRSVFSLNVYEIDTQDGGIDHQIDVSGNYGGLNLQFTSTVDQIRKFFTEKREKGKPALTAVK